MDSNIEEIEKNIRRIEKQLAQNEVSPGIRLYHFRQAADHFVTLGEMVSSGLIRTENISEFLKSKLVYANLDQKITPKDIFRKTIEMYNACGDIYKAAHILIKYEIDEPRDLVRDVLDRAINLADELDDYVNSQKFEGERTRLMALKKY